MFKKIKNLLQIGVKKKTVDNFSVEIDYNDIKDKKVFVVLPYGLFNNPPDGTLAIPLSIDGVESNQVCFLTEDGIRDTLEEGEVAIGIPEKNARILFAKDAKIVFTTENAAGGDFMVRFNKLKEGFDQLKQDFNTFVTNVHNSSVIPHTHGYNPGPGPLTQTGTAVITAGTESTASIDQSKIIEIEVPEV